MRFNEEIINRIKFANSIDEGESSYEFIASAIPFEDYLLVVSCSGEVLKMPWVNVKPLKNISYEERGHFRINKHGSCIEWKEQDVHMDIECIKNSIY